MKSKFKSYGKVNPDRLDYLLALSFVVIAITSLWVGIGLSISSDGSFFSYALSDFFRSFIFIGGAANSATSAFVSILCTITFYSALGVSIWGIHYLIKNNKKERITALIAALINIIAINLFLCFFFEFAIGRCKEYIHGFWPISTLVFILCLCGMAFLSFYAAFNFKLDIALNGQSNQKEVKKTNKVKLDSVEDITLSAKGPMLEEVKKHESDSNVVLSVKDLVVHFSTDHGYVQAVRGVSFDLYKGETLCIVGESGSGKSVTSKTIMGILAANGRIINGSIMYEGEDLTKVSEDEFHRIRGHKIGMIFQDPLSSLNPIMRIGKQITEAMLVNNDRLKKLFNDLVAKELVAYKNSVTERKIAIFGKKDHVNFLKVEKKKVIESYIVTHQEISGEIYNKKKNLGAQISDLNHEYNEKIEELSRAIARNENVEANNNEIKRLNEELQAKLDDLKIIYSEDIKELKSHRPEERARIKEEIKKIKSDYNAKIKEAKYEYRSHKHSLVEKYKPIIKEKKEAYNLKAKEAKKQVAEYASKLKKEYHEKRNTLLIEKRAATTPHARAVADAKLNKLEEVYLSSVKITKKEAKERALKIMAEVGIPQPEKRFRQYPFEFSGGMRQRIVIAIALTADPDILICDEPTTALDVTIQAQILELINRLKAQRNLSCIFITHDLGVVANMADRVAVMYAGKIVEYGLANEIFYDPKHPYTWALLSSIPDVDSKERLDAIPGTPPNMIYPPKGDAFALRSKYAMKVDFIKEPPFFKVSDTHYAATWLLDPRAPKVEMPKIVSTRIANSIKTRAGKENK